MKMSYNMQDRRFSRTIAGILHYYKPTFQCSRCCFVPCDQTVHSQKPQTGVSVDVLMNYSILTTRKMEIILLLKKYNNDGQFVN